MDFRLGIAYCKLPFNIGLNFKIMKNRNVIISAILLGVIFLTFMIRRWNEPVTRELFNRHPKSIVYTKHALCRMSCRSIDRSEIKEIMEKGIINFNKTNKSDRPCPTFALQGRTISGESIRVIFAQCDSTTKVITCYNLEEDPECDCSGTPANSRQKENN